MRLPKLAEKIKANLKGNVTAATLKQTCTSKQMNILQTQFRTSQTPAEKEKYKSLTMPEKWEWMAQWMLDPEMSKAQGFNSKKVMCSNMHNAQDGWKTFEQIADIMKSDQHAQIAIDGNEFFYPSRTSCPAWRQQG